MNTKQQELKQQLVEAWQQGDNTRVAEKVSELYPHLKVTPQAVSLWKLGQRPNSKLAPFIVEAALVIHMERGLQPMTATG